MRNDEEGRDRGARRYGRRDFLRIAGGAVGAGGLRSAFGAGPVPGPPPGLVSAAGRGAASRRHRRADEVRVGYLPITDATPLLMAHANGYYAEEGLVAEKPRLFRGWSPLAEAFQARQVDVVHILMPMAVWLRFGRGFPLKLVAWCHTGGSALTVSNRVDSLDGLIGETSAVPFWYSIHNVLLQMLLRDAGITALTRGDASVRDRSAKLVVMAPPDMPPALANRSISGYIVADPFNAVAEVNRIGKVLRLTNDVWRDHACCVVIMHEDDVVERPGYAQSVVNAVVKAQLFARNELEETARVLSKDGGDYLPQPREVIEWALTHHGHDHYPQTGAIRHPEWNVRRIDFQPFPFPTYTEELVRRLKETEVEGDTAFLAALNAAAAHDRLVDERFVREAIAAVGGPSGFDLPDSLRRVEQIAV